MVDAWDILVIYLRNPINIHNVKAGLKKIGKFIRSSNLNILKTMDKLLDNLDC